MAKLTEKSLATAVTLNSLIHIVNTGDTAQSAYGSSYKAELSQLVPLFGSNPDVTVTGGTYNPSTGEITFYNNTGGTFNVSGFITGFTDSYVSGGTYAAGTATFTNTTGGTFTVTGFTSGNTNFANTNLIFDANREHDTNGFNYQLTSDGGLFAEGWQTLSQFDSSIGWGGQYIYTNSNDIRFYIINNETVRIDNSGNVGIGTTSPSEKLDVSGNTKISGSLNIGNILGNTPIGNLGFDSSGNVVTGTTGLVSDIYVSGGTYTAGTATFTNTTGGTFNVSGFISGDTNIANTDLALTFNRSIDMNGWLFGMYDGAGLDGFGPTISFEGALAAEPKLSLGHGYYINPTSNNTILDIGVKNGKTGFTFSTNSVEKVIIDINGDVGIGTTSPSEKLEVSGKTKTINFQMTSGATNGYVLTSDASGNASWQASSGGVSIDPFNNIGSTGTSFTWDVSGLSTNYQVTLTANTTLNLSNVRNGDYGTLIVTQDTIGSRTVTFGTVNGAGTTHRVVNGGGGSPVLTSNANAIDILTFTYNGSTMFWTVGNDYT